MNMGPRMLELACMQDASCECNMLLQESVSGLY
jgi:hypothetical protein